MPKLTPKLMPKLTPKLMPKLTNLRIYKYTLDK
jgi:ribosomal protein S30